MFFLFKIATICTAIVATIGLSGDQSEKIDLLNQFQEIYFYALLSSSIILVYVFWREKSHFISMMISAVGLIVSATFVIPSYLHDPIANQTILKEFENRKPFKLLSYNVHHDDLDDEQFLSYINDVKPDFIIVQEFSGKEIAPVAERLRKIYKNEIRCIIPSYCTTLIYSNYDLSNQELSDLATDVLFQNGFSRLSLATFSISNNDTEKEPTHLALYGIHLHWPLTFNDKYLSQREQIDLLKLSAGSLSRNTEIIISGDFNTSPWSFNFKRLLSGKTDLRQVDKFNRSWGPVLSKSKSPLHIPVLDIDHIVASSKIHIKSIIRAPDMGSDHFPYLLEFYIQE